jgi:hypothetical protein
MVALPWSEVIAAAGITQTIELQEFRGRGPRGDVFDPAITVEDVFVEDKRRRVRTATGDQVWSTRTVYAPPGTGGEPGSLVTYAGVTSAVVSRAYHDGGGMPTPDHVELALE